MKWWQWPDSNQSMGTSGGIAWITKVKSTESWKGFLLKEFPAALSSYRAPWRRMNFLPWVLIRLSSSQSIWRESRGRGCAKVPLFFPWANILPALQVRKQMLSKVKHHLQGHVHSDWVLLCSQVPFSPPHSKCPPMVTTLPWKMLLLCLCLAAAFQRPARTHPWLDIRCPLFPPLPLKFDSRVQQ